MRLRYAVPSRPDQGLLLHDDMVQGNRGPGSIPPGGCDAVPIEGAGELTVIWKAADVMKQAS